MIVNMGGSVIIDNDDEPEEVIDDTVEEVDDDTENK